jgi:hypothetical protein
MNEWEDNGRARPYYHRRLPDNHLIHIRRF